MPFPYGGYKRPYISAFGNGMSSNYNNYKRQRTYAPPNMRLGSFRGRSVRRFNRGGAPYRQGGFRPIPARTALGLNRPSGLSEKKFVDVSTTVNADDVGSVTLLNGMTQGTSQSTRIGNKISMTSVQFRLAAFNGATTTQSPIMRFLVVYDKQTNAATPAITDILVASTVVSPMNLANRDRFVVLAEETFRPDNTFNDTAAVAEFSEYKARYLKLRLDTIYNNTSGGTVADIQTGALWFIALSTSINGTAEPAVTLYTRTRYTDC